MPSVAQHKRSEFSEVGFRPSCAGLASRLRPTVGYSIADPGSHGSRRHYRAASGASWSGSLRPRLRESDTVALAGRDYLYTIVIVVLEPGIEGCAIPTIVTFSVVIDWFMSIML